MPFRVRLQFPGAIYHVINRGNYRSWIFARPRTKLAFEACLGETCTRYGWLLHAFATMNNHFHLALETPLGNLAAGMQWLESTFANRFNRLRDERGHLFQSLLSRRNRRSGTGTGRKKRACCGGRQL